MQKCYWAEWDRNGQNADKESASLNYHKTITLIY